MYLWRLDLWLSVSLMLMLLLFPLMLLFPSSRILIERLRRLDAMSAHFIEHLKQLNKSNQKQEQPQQQ